MKGETLQCIGGVLDGQYHTIYEGAALVWQNASGSRWVYKKRRRDNKDVLALTGVHVRFTHSRRVW